MAALKQSITVPAKDVNLLMALLWQNHEHHQIARGWLGSIVNFATCPVSQLGFGRISSHSLLGYGMSPDQAFTVLRQFLSDPRHRFITDSLSCEDRIIRTDLMLGANQVNDHYLVALARQNKLTLATLDDALARAFRREPDIVPLVR